MPSHKEWLFIARTDLDNAKVLFEADRFSGTIYHSQQAVEKALKGFLAFKKQKIRKTHDLSILIDLCAEFNQDFLQFLEYSFQLKEYATLGRYPDDSIHPELDEARDALEHAEMVVSFVEERTFIKKIV